MNDDFNTPIAVSILFELASETNRTRDAATAALLKQLAGMLGLLQRDPREHLQGGADIDTAWVQERIAARAQAKAARDFGLSDAIRKELADRGIVLKDSAQGTTWEKG